ncbi:MAG: DNA repair protein RecN, partial [Pseudomonadota bacterium]
DDRGLLNTAGHRALLDQYAQNDGLIAACQTTWRSLSKTQNQLSDHKAALAAVAEEESFLRHAVQELDDLAPEPGEDALLDQRRRMMQAAEKIKDDVAKAQQALGSDGAETALVNAMRWLETAAGQVDGALDTPLATVSQVMSVLGDAQAQVDQVMDNLSFDAQALDQAEERLFALRALARKHGVGPDDLADLTKGLRAKLDALDQGTGEIAALERAVATAQTDFDTAAAALTDNRMTSARALDSAMAQELGPLKMERAQFETHVSVGSPGPGGQDDVALCVATNPGAPAGPLNKIASGGELSRFLLALKVCLVADGTPRTMIFDEIDRGVGGATADAVGRRLRALGRGGQVLVVTHSPQVAALGQAHWRVEKHATDDTTVSTVVALSADMRVDEVARMLSGDTITQAARDAAQALIAASA